MAFIPFTVERGDPELVYVYNTPSTSAAEVAAPGYRRRHHVSPKYIVMPTLRHTNFRYPNTKGAEAKATLQNGIRSQLGYGICVTLNKV
jgi:hypothetical protein